MFKPNAPEKDRIVKNLQSLVEALKVKGWTVEMSSGRVPPPSPRWNLDDNFSLSDLFTHKHKPDNKRTENMEPNKTEPNNAFYSATVVADLSLELRAMTKHAGRMAEQLEQLRKEHERVKTQASLDKLTLGNKEHEIAKLRLELGHAQAKVIRLLKLRETSIDVLRISSPTILRELRRLKCKTLSDVAQINPANTTKNTSERLFNILSHYLEHG